MPSTVFGVILAGGQSSRLFPFNKVLSDLTDSGRTLLQQSFDRLVARGRIAPITKPDQVYVLTARDFVAPMRKQLGLPRNHFLTDPVRRGTWPALLWAMAHIRQRDPKALLAVVTADHVIPNVNAFRQSVSEAIELAFDESAVALVGVKPTHRPDEWRGFGAVCAQGNHITAFEEKPTLARATEMIQEGRWLWNAGMFFFQISTAERALRHYQPEMARTYEALVEAVRRRDRSEAERLFSNFPLKITHSVNPSRQVDNTMDYAIMTPLVHQPSEISARVATRALVEWTDLGQWDALRKVVKVDKRQNVRIGKVHVDAETSGSILVADKGYQLEARGVRGLVAAFSNRTLLLLPEQSVPDVKALVQAAQESGARSVFERACTDGRFEIKSGRVIAQGLSGVHVRMSGKAVVVSGAGFIR